MSLLTPDLLGPLVAAANAAPSADNRHVFRLRATDDSGSISLYPSEALFEPPAHRGTLGLLSIGAAVENLVLRGARLGLTLTPGTVQPPLLGRELLRLQAQPAGAVASALEEAIDERHSNRSLRFSSIKLLPEERSQLDADASAIAGAGLSWLDEPVQRRRALALIRTAETQRFNDGTLHRELFDAIRFDVGWSATVSQGLPPGALGLSRWERLAFSLLRHWRLQQLGNFLGLHYFIGFRAADLPCRLAPHLCAVTSRGFEVGDAIAAGRALQRIWLRVTAMGWACQVFAAPALYARDEACTVPARVREQLRAGWQTLSPGRCPYILMRLGRAAPAAVRAGRAAPDQLLARSECRRNSLQAEACRTQPQR